MYKVSSFAHSLPPTTHLDITESLKYFEKDIKSQVVRTGWRPVVAVCVFHMQYAVYCVTDSATFLKEKKRKEMLTKSLVKFSAYKAKRKQFPQATLISTLYWISGGLHIIKFRN